MRLTGSMYKTDKAMSNTLYGGDRAGSRYYYVLENTAATETGAEGLRADQPRLQEQGHGDADEPVREVPRPRAVRRHRARRGQGVDRSRPSGPGSSTRSTRSTASCRTRSCSSAPATTRRTATLAGITGDVGARPLAGRRRLVHHARTCWRRPSTSTRSTSAIPPTNIKNGGKFNGLMLEGVVAF